MDIQKKREISQKLNVNYDLLLLQMKNDMMKFGFTVKHCPNCNKIPKLLNNDEFGFRMKCGCGYISFDERY